MLVRAVNQIVFSCGGDSPETQYQQMERRYGNGYNRRLIDGKITGCGKCVGYCKYQDHAGFLTKDLRKEHNCLGKGCFYYISKKGERTIPYTAYPMQLSVQL